MVHGRHVAFRSSLTLTLPRSLGAVCGAATPAASPTGVPAARAVSSTEDESRRGLLPDAWRALRDGVRVLFASDTLLRSSMLISFGVVMVMGSLQGLALPVHFTAANTPELLGYVLSAMSAGMLASSLGYAALAHKLRRRTWYILPLTGMALGILGLGLLPPFPLLIASALMLGLSASPISALLGFFIFDRIPPKIEEAPSARRIRSPWPPRPWPSSPPRSSWRAPGCPWPPWPSPAAGCSSPCGPSTPTA